MAKEIVCAFGTDVDSVAGWIGSYGGGDSPSDIQRGVFASEVGIIRLLRLFKKYNLKTTFFIPGHSIETFPDECRKIVEEGHEIGAHGYSHENPVAMTPKQEEAVLVKSIEVIEKLSGKKPRGYVAPWWEMSASTAALLQKYGFKYDHSQGYRDFQPFYARVGDSWTLIDYSKQAEEWMKPLQHGKEIDLVEIGANWYVDDLPPMMFIKKVSEQSRLRQSSRHRGPVAPAVRLGLPRDGLCCVLLHHPSRRERPSAGHHDARTADRIR